MAGALCLLGPFAGLAMTVLGVQQAFQVLGGNSVGDPQELSVSIGNVLIATIIGFGFGVAGLVFTGIALFGMRYRAPWLFWFLSVCGVILLGGVPIGTVLGIGLITYCVINRSEFLRRGESA